MTRIFCFSSAAVLVAVVLIGPLSATPIPQTPEEPPHFAVLKAAENQSLTFIYWRPVIEQSVSGTPVLVNQPREVTVEQSKVVGRAVAGRVLENEKAWQALIGTAMILVPHDATIDDIYKAAMNPDTVLVQPKGELPNDAPSPYPDGTLPADTPSDANAQVPGAPTPQEIAAAQQAIAPEVTRLKLKITPAPIVNSVINQALPGYMFFVAPSDDDENGSNKGNRRPLRVIIKKPDGSAETVTKDDDDENENNRIFAILREQMTVLTVADARKYARVHLLLACARHPQYKFGPINNISVTSNANGGLSVHAEAPILNGGKGQKSTAFTLTASFGKNGKVVGGMRGRR